MKRNTIAYAFIVLSALSMNQYSKADPRDALVAGGAGGVVLVAGYIVWQWFTPSLASKVTKAKLQQELAKVGSKKQLYLELKKHHKDEHRDELGLPLACKSAALKFLVTHTKTDLHEIASEFNRLYPVKPKTNKVLTPSAA
ncbi:MAG TPA: hypothetical protein VGT41_03285 [Candidatus Babeliales bacterium]|nr:hypothetical protein [Candidatus Babeliales bacterium]